MSDSPAEVWYPGEIDSPWENKPHGEIPESLNNLAKIENILTLLSDSQVGSKDGKNYWSKISLHYFVHLLYCIYDHPFKVDAKYV